jgi:hypothetical protein
MKLLCVAERDGDGYRLSVNPTAAGDTPDGALER